VSVPFDWSVVESRLRRDFLAAGVPSLVVAVSRQGELLWEKAFGWADVERRVPAGIDTMYSLASTTKPFTATALMILAERGQIDLDRPVNDFLPADCRLKVRVGHPDGVTVRCLFCHTSGLPAHLRYFTAEERLSKPPFEETLRRYGNIVAEPGERFCYSNLGYGVMDYLVSRISGVDFGTFLHREIFLPLGMTRSSLDTGHGHESYAAERYDSTGRPVPIYELDHPGASSIYSSMRDLLAFGNFHLGFAACEGNPILPRAVIEDMQVPVADRHNLRPPEHRWPPASGASLGWAVAQTPWGPLVSSAGGMLGASAQLVLLPSAGIAIAAATNGGCGIPRSIDQYLLPALIPGYPEKAEWHRLPPAPVQTPDLSGPGYRQFLGEWQGCVHTYETGMPVTLRFLPSGAIHATLGHQQQTTLVNDVQWKDGWLRGAMAGCIETGDALCGPRHPHHHVFFELKLRGDRLCGVFISSAGNTLAYWTELRRASD
jgi:CubicO group peptidase (beta-lactamase class C family)